MNLKMVTMHYTPDAIYNDFLSELKRIFGKEIVPEDKQFIFQTFIYDRIPGSELQYELNRPSIHELRELLRLKPVQDQTMKILGMMKLAKSWFEFEELAGNHDSLPV